MFNFKKKLLSSMLAVVMVITLIPANEVTNPVEEVYAAADMSEYADTFVVTDEIIPDTTLFNALTNLLGQGFTIGDLKNYEGEIDLSAYPTIGSVVGLGYARSASSIDLSTLTLVERIEEKEFLSCSFTTFKLPLNITYIGKEAFEYCANLETIVFPESLKTIEQLAFNECTSLDDIVLPSGLVKLGTSAFQACTSLSEIVIPDGMNAMSEGAGDDANSGIGAQVFMGCTSLANVTFGTGMTTIPSGFLQGTTSLLFVDIPTKISVIRDNAFAYSGLLHVDLTANTGITVINKSTFAGCTQLLSAKLPNTITRIDEAAFSNCSLQLSQEITALPNLEYIGDNAFTWTDLTDVTVGGKVATIGYGAFSNCLSLEKVTIDDYPSAPEVASVKLIGQLAFSTCTKLYEVVLPTKYEDNINATIEIGKNAFENCLVLEKINFPANVTKIGDYAFSGCASTDNYYDAGLGYETATIRYVLRSQLSATDNGGKKYEFFSNTDERFYVFDEYYITGDLYTRELSAPEGDESVMIYVNLHTNEEENNDSDLAENFIVKEQFFTGIINADLSKCLSLQMGKGVFRDCFNLNTATLPKTMKVIPEQTFYGCSVARYTGSGKNKTFSSIGTMKSGVSWYHGLVTVNMSSNVTQISKSAFYNCRELVLKDDLPTKLETIGESAFVNCENIGGLTLPKTLKTIEKAAFSGCGRMKEYQLIAGYGLTSINAQLASNLTTIGNQAFKGCSFNQFLMNDVAPVTTIQNSAFADCQYLTSIRFSNAVKYIGSGALARCTRLLTVSIPDICTLDNSVCLSGQKIKEILYPDINVSITVDPDGKITYYLTTNEFAMTVRPTVEKVMVRVNGSAILPVVTPDSAGVSKISKIKIGDIEYEFDENGELLTTVPSDATIIPSIVTVKNTVTAYAVKLDGISETTDVDVQVQLNLQYGALSSDTISIMLAPQVEYTVDVTENTCQEIIINDKQYISYSKSSAVTLEPNFVPTFEDSVITDKVSWTVISGNDLITLTPAADGLSANYKPTKNGYGTATVEIKAGAVTKVVYINVVAPASSLTVSTYKMDMMISSTAQLTATMSYSSTYGDVKEQYPDAVTFISDAPDIVEITNVYVIGDTTYCDMKAKAVGTANITATAVAGARTRTISVVVTADDLETYLFNSAGEPVENGDVVSIIGKAGQTFTHSFSQTLNDTSVIVGSSDASVATATYNTSTKKITVAGKKKGTATISVYPKVGTLDANGVSFTVKVDGDITGITLSKKTVALGQTTSVFAGMKNAFGQEIKDISQVGTITDNTIEFTSSSPSYVSVDSKGNVKVLKLSNPIEAVTITCKAYRDGVEVKSATTTVTPTKPNVTSVSYTGTTTMYVGESKTIQLAYAPTNGAYKSYRVLYMTGSSSYIGIAFDSSTQKLVVTGKKAGTAQVKVEITTSDKTITKIITFTVKQKISLKRVVQNKPVAKKKKVTISWKKVDGATGYEIQMSTKKKKGYKLVKTLKKGTKVKFTKKKLKRKKKYFFKVRAFAKTSDGIKYGKWSKAKKVKTK